MPRPRESHIPKTREERDSYYSTTIRGGGPSPTIDRSRPDQDSTATAMPVGAIEATGTSQRTARQSAVSVFLREKGLEIFVGLVLLSLLAWILLQLFSLNR